MGQFMGVMLDPAMAGPRQFAPQRDGVDAAQGAGRGRLQCALGRLGGRLRRIAERQWRCCARLQQDHQQRLWLGGRRRLSPLAEHGGGLCARRRRHHFRVANGGSGNSDLFQAGGYLRHTQGAAYLAAALAYGWQDVTTNRTVTAAGFDSLRGRFNANALSGRLEGGYRVAGAVMDVTPYAAGQFISYRLPSYTEQVVSGANTFALAYGGKDVMASRTELGVAHRTILRAGQFDADAARPARLGA